MKTASANTSITQNAKTSIDAVLLIYLRIEIIVSQGLPDFFGVFRRFYPFFGYSTLNHTFLPVLWRFSKIVFLRRNTFVVRELRIGDRFGEPDAIFYFNSYVIPVMKTKPKPLVKLKASIDTFYTVFLNYNFVSINKLKGVFCAFMRFFTFLYYSSLIVALSHVFIRFLKFVFPAQNTFVLRE